MILSETNEVNQNMPLTVRFDKARATVFIGIYAPWCNTQVVLLKLAVNAPRRYSIPIFQNHVE